MPRSRLSPLDVTLYGIVVFAWGFSWIAMHYQIGMVEPEISVVWRFAIAAPVMFAMAALRGQPFVIEPSAGYIGGLLYLALIGSVVAFACYLTLLGRIGTNRAAYSTVMFPVVALVVSTLVENYRWTIPATFGLLAVLAGNLLVLRPSRTK